MSNPDLIAFDEPYAGGSAPPSLPPVRLPFARPGDGADPHSRKAIPQAISNAESDIPQSVTLTPAAVARKAKRLRHILLRKVYHRSRAERVAWLSAYTAEQAAERADMLRAIREVPAPAKPARKRSGALCVEIWTDSNGRTWREYLAPDPRAGTEPQRC